MKKNIFFTIMVIAIMFVHTACEHFETSGEYFHSNLRGYWATKEDIWGRNIQLEITRNYISISGDYNPTGNPLYDFEKDFMLSGYSVETKQENKRLEGELYIKDIIDNEFKTVPYIYESVGVEIKNEILILIGESKSDNLTFYPESD